MNAADDAQAALLKAFRAFCVAQFPVDLADGDAGLAARDAAALRRVAHNLASVLLTLREPLASACARRLEAALLAADWAAAEPAWHALRPHLSALVAEQGSATKK